MAVTGLIETAGWSLLGAPPLARLAGRTLLAHVVEASRRSSEVGRLVVLTDDPAETVEARRLGVEVGSAPHPIDGAARGLARALAVASAVASGVVLSLGPGAALLVPDDFKGAARLDGGHSAVLVFHWVGDAVMRDGDEERPRLMLDSGALYAVRVGMARDGRAGGRKEIPADRVATIAGRFDFARAERAIEAQGQADRLAMIPTPPSAVVFDFDGVMTDNKVYVLQDGREAVACSRSDGWGITRLKKTGIPLLVLSTERNPVVRARCEKLGLACLHGYDEKSIALRQWLDENRVDPARVIYLGNDLNDLPSMGLVGCPVAVGDAYPEVIAACRFVLRANGGAGAVRELADLVMQASQRPS